MDDFSRCSKEDTQHERIKLALCKKKYSLLFMATSMLHAVSKEEISKLFRKKKILAYGLITLDKQQFFFPVIIIKAVYMKCAALKPDWLGSWRLFSENSRDVAHYSVIQK